MVVENTVCYKCGETIECRGVVGITGVPLFTCACAGWMIFKREDDHVLGGVQWADQVVEDVSELPPVPLQARMV